MPLRSSSFLSLSLSRLRGRGAKTQEGRKRGGGGKTKQATAVPLLSFLSSTAKAALFHPMHARSPNERRKETTGAVCCSLARCTVEEEGMHWPRGGSSISSNELRLHARTVLSLWKVGLQGLSHSHFLMPIDFLNLYGSPNLAYTIGAHHK